MQHPATSQSVERRLAIAVRGVVQGVGFRPFVYNAARGLGLRGWVQNEADTVRIEVQGSEAAVEAFLDALRHRHPPQARLDEVLVDQRPCETAAGEFSIRESGHGAAPRPTIPADLATCGECLDEIRRPGERRHAYPFTNCTNCGPRWSIIERLPYDRPRTSMASFAMCPACEAEYRNPADRRFHAQPIACPACGPQLELLDASGHHLAGGPEALDRAAKAVVEGRIVALKGLGGFQLIVDATREAAVSRLRTRKRRPDKPFALMMASLDEVRRHCEVSEDEARMLASHQAPILLLERTSLDADQQPIAPGVAPGNPYLGVMLPYTPLHHRLLAAVARPIVCTSGNLSEEPMATTTPEALARLGSIADAFLVHDRPIVRPVDDSVARIAPWGIEVHRRARGFFPMPIELGRPGPTVLAVGGHLKNTVALALGSQVVVGSHVGDLDNLASVEVHRRAIDDLVEFFRAAPQAVACDLHPDYASTRQAESLAAAWGVPLIRVQHHHAHIAACMAEHRLEGPVLGFSWDGTGYGPDGTVWGGEALECVGAEFRRVAHLRTFPLPGGDRAIREPRRTALGLLFEMLGEAAADHVRDWFTPMELQTLLGMLRRPGLCPRTSSLGRLFDAVAAICGMPLAISFEGQAAMALEYAAKPTDETYPSLESREANSSEVADWAPMVAAILADRAAGRPVAEIAGSFHNTLAEWAVAVAGRWDGRQVALGGGCFHNALLAGLVRGRLAASGFSVFSNQVVPPGDGGIALGQIGVARIAIQPSATRGIAPCA
jgi:hydrogenase maturation protein HypF